MRVVVVSEGIDEVGRDWHDRSLLDPVPIESQGALERLVSRLGKEIWGEAAEIVAFRRPRSKTLGHVGQPSLTTILTDADLLSQVLTTTLTPADRGLRVRAAHGVLVVCDLDLEGQVSNAFGRATDYVPAQRAAHVTLRPEFEAILFEKPALERAVGATPCSVKVPAPAEIAADAKKALEGCLKAAGYGGNVSGATKKRIVENLTTQFLVSDGPESLAEIRQALARFV